jgi:Flp pilus assembly protein TadB
MIIFLFSGRLKTPGSSRAAVNFLLMSPLFASVLFALGVGALVLALFPQQAASVFSTLDPKRGMRARFQERLRAARIFDQTPTLVILALAIVSLIGGLIIAVLISSWVGILLGPPLVIVAVNIYLMRRQRDHLLRASNELVPFLNRISTAVKAGRPPETAYLEAVAEADTLKGVLEDSAAKISAGANFAESLVATLDDLPLRMWAVFVRQLELYYQLGGDVTTAIDTTVIQVNSMLQLQAEARADYAIQAKQQKLIVGIVVGFFGGYVLLVPGASAQVGAMFQSVGGIIAFSIAIGVMGFGLWFRAKQLQAVEKRMAF